jgi:hypothetical protein
MGSLAHLEGGGESLVVPVGSGAVGRICGGLDDLQQEEAVDDHHLQEPLPLVCATPLGAQVQVRALQLLRDVRHGGRKLLQRALGSAEQVPQRALLVLLHGQEFAVMVVVEGAQRHHLRLR